MTTATISATAARLVVALLAALSVLLAAPAHAAIGDLQPPTEPFPKAGVKAEPECDHDQGPGISYQVTFKNDPGTGVPVYLIRWKPLDGPAQSSNGPAGFLPTGTGEFQVQGVVSNVTQWLPKVELTTYETDWLDVTVDCDDPDQEPEPEDEDEDEDEPGDNGGGGNPGTEVQGSDIVQATPNFTG